MNLRAYLALGRPSNLPTVWTDVLAAAVLARAFADTRTVLLLVLACSLLYTAGMFLNDAFDRKFDARERPERPIPAGQVTPLEVYVVGAAMLVVGVLIVGVIARGWVGIAAAIALALLIIVYDANHKENPFAPVVMGGCRAFVYFTTAAALTNTITSDVAFGAIALWAWVVGLTYVARQENFAGFTGFSPLVLLAVPIVRALPAALGSVTTALLIVVLVAWIARSCLLLMKTGKGSVGRAVVALIAGISLVDALAIASTGETGLALLAVLGLPATLLFQRWVRGT